MTDPLLVLFVGSIGAAVLGLIGIKLTQFDNTSTVDTLNEGDLKAYRLSRLMREGVSYCTMGKHEFRLTPGGSQTACPQCLPPPVPPADLRTWEPHSRPEHPSRPLNFARSYTPLHAWWPELYEKGDDDEANF